MNLKCTITPMMSSIKTNQKILVVAHIFYHEMWSLIAEKIENLKGYDFDLIVSTTSNLEELTSRVHEKFADAKVVLTENRGYDIWPFIKVLKTLDLDKYEYVVKVHTKRDMGKIIASIDDKYFFRGSSWRDMLLSFISTRENLDKCIRAFEEDPSIGMINNHRLFDITRESADNPHFVYCFTEARKLLCSVGIKPYPYNEVKYVAGTMFICRASILKPLLAMDFDVSQFAAVNRKNENDLAHVTERLFGWLVSSQGYSFGAPFNTFKESFHFFFHCALCKLLIFKLRHRWFSKFVRFLFRFEDRNEMRYLIIFKCLKIKFSKSSPK
ncbi:MAG: rhamnan synthesis F family protein [Succinivibrio sp.]